MQGDIFQLETLTSQIAVPKLQPTAASARTKSGPQVSIYNEDDLSHLLYVSSNPHHHHHHHHHTHEPRPFVHPADNGTVLINTVMDDMEYSTPALSDCESCSGSESSGMDIEGPITPPSEVDSEALEAYRSKGRRNALSVEDGFPIFLGRQDEEWQAPEALAQSSLNLMSPAVTVKKAETEEIPVSRHADAIKGPVMSWWPEPLETMKTDWALENMEWELEIEKEKLREREREGGIMNNQKHYDEDYSTRNVANIEGRLMSWWPEPLNTAEYEWSERFYE